MLRRIVHHIPGEGPVQAWLNGRGIHGPQVAYWSGLAFAALLVAVALILAFVAATGRGRDGARVDARGRAAVASAAVIALCVSGVTYAAAQAGSPDPQVRPTSVAAVSTPAPFRSVQVAEQVCLTNPTEQILLPRTVRQGDFLLLVFSGQAYRARPATISRVEDSLNGPWHELYNRLTETPGGQQRIDFGAFEMEGSRRGRDVISIAGDWGRPGGATVTVLDIGGTSGRSAAAFAGGVTADGDGTVTSPTVSSTPGELLLGVFGAYDYGQSLRAAPGWTMDARAGSYYCSATAIEHMTMTTAAGRQRASLETGSHDFSGFGAGVLALLPSAPASDD